MDDDKPTREELRKRLRNKIHDKRTGNSSMESLAKTVKNDPQTALMSLGIDDPNILKSAKDIFKDPHQLLNSLKIEDKKENNVDEEEEEEEELPPDPI